MNDPTGVSPALTVPSFHRLICRTTLLASTDFHAKFRVKMKRPGAQGRRIARMVRELFGQSL
jgi:hypothetical protein